MTEPIRMCLACRRRAAKGQLVRLVVEDDPVGTSVGRAPANGDRHRGRVVVDPGARRPGRGAYLCRRTDCLQRALRRNGAAIRRGLRVGPQQAAVDAEALVASWEPAISQQANGQDNSANPSGRQR